MKINQIVVMLFGMVFAAFGIGFLVAPEQAAQYFQVEAVGAAGLVTLRADLGGLFLGLAVLCLAGAVRKSRSLLFAAAIVLVAIALGRLVGMIGGGGPGGQVGSLAIEVASIAALIACARGLGLGEDFAKRSLARRWLVAGGIAVAAVGAGTALLRDARVELLIFERGARQVTARQLGPAR